MQTIQRLEDRKDFLARCSRCSQCKFVSAPTSQKHASACPSMDYGQWHAYSASGQIIMGYGVMENRFPVSAEMLRAVGSCTMCGHCDVSCKTNFGETVEPLDSLYALRAKLAETGQSPAAHRTMIENLRRQGNTAGHDRTQRARWAEGLHFPTSAQRPEVLLHIGSTLAFDAARWDSLRTVAQMLQSAGVAVQHLGLQEGSTGSAAFDIGFVEDVKTFAKQMVEAVRNSGASTLVTFSAPALAAFRAVYPRFGLDFGNVRVLHFTEYVLELISSGRLSLRKPSSLSGTTVAYHDSCKLGRLSEPWRKSDLGLDREMNGVYVSREPHALRWGNNGCYDAPRELLRAMGLDLAELPRSRSSSFCCGACGGAKEAEPESAALAARSRLSELTTVPTNVMVSGCSGCTRHLGQHAEQSTRVADLLDLVAQALAPAPKRLEVKEHV